MKFLTLPFRFLSLSLFSLALLAGCDPDDDSGPSKPPGPTLSVEPVGQFRFTWPASESSTHYRILENPDGRSGFTDVSGDIPVGTESFTLTVPLHARSRAQYLLQRCNADGCSDSRATSVTSNLANGIGYLKPDSVQANNYQFGRAIALSGDGQTLAISGGNSQTIAAGSNRDVSIFIRSSQGQWQHQQTLPLPSVSTSLSLSDDGNHLAVGSRYDGKDAQGVFASHTDVTAVGSSDSGALYLFTRNAGSWTETAYIKASNNHQNANFGVAVSLSVDGSRVAVGAYGESNSVPGIQSSFPGTSANTGLEKSGAVYLYQKVAGQWTEEVYIKASNADENARFGVSLSLSGDGNFLVVGSDQEDNNFRGISSAFPGTTGNTGLPNSGAAYLYRLDGGLWSEQAYIKASNAVGTENFGISVSLSQDGDVLAIGAEGEASTTTGVHSAPISGTGNNRFSSGAVYVYSRTGNTWTSQAYIKAGNSNNNDHFGSGVVLSGDGQWLAVVAEYEDSKASGVHASGARQTNNEATDSGAVYLYQRRHTLWQERSYLKASNNRVGDRGFGQNQFSTAVGLSDDGEQLVIGSWGEGGVATGIQGDQNDRSGTNIGAVYLY